MRRGITGEVYMAGISTYAANKILDHILGVASWTMPTNVYVSLHTADPGLTGANEVGASWYTTGGRKQPTSGWNAATTSGATNNGNITFPTVSGSSVTVTHVGIWDSATVGAGNFLLGIALPSSKLFSVGSIPFISSFTVTCGGIASNYLIPKIIDHLLGTASFSFDSTLFLALYTTDPTVADTGTEATGGGYARQAWAANAAASRATENTSLIDYGSASAGIGTVGWWGIRTASSGGNLHAFGAWNSALSIDNGDTYQVPAGNLDLTAS